MSDKAIHAAAGIALAVIGLGIIALFVSRNAQTGSVFGALGDSLSNVLGCALSPITGKKCSGGGGIPSVTSSISFDMSSLVH